MFMPCFPSQGRAGGTGQAGTFQFGKQMTVREKVRRHPNQEWKQGRKK